MDIILFFFLGASIGSFLGLLIDRFPEESILFPQSYCNFCRQYLQARDLIPVLSQLINKCCCRFCKTKIPIWYGFFEIACGLGFVLSYMNLLAPIHLFLLLFSTTLSLYDLKSQEFPLLVWLLPTLTLLLFSNLNLLTLIIFLLGITAELIDLRIGSGDFLYLSTLSIILDLQNILWIVQISSLLGIFYCLIYKNRRIPFLPFLSGGYLIYLILS